MTQQPSNPWDTPAPPSEGGYPTIAQLGGRLVVMEPKLLTENVPDQFNAGKTKDRITADVTFLDGETITHSVDKFNKATPLPKPVQRGETITGMYVSQSVLVTQLKQAMPQHGGRGMVLGRLTLGEQRGTNNPPWMLTQASPQDEEQARAWYTWRQNQQASAAMQAPAPVQQQVAPAQGQAFVQQQPVQQAPQQPVQYAAPAPQAPVYAPPVPQGPGPQQGAAPQAPAWGQQPAQGGANIDPSPSF